MQQTQKCKFNSKKSLSVGGNGPISSQCLMSYNYHQGKKNGLNDLHLFDYIWYLYSWVVVYAAHNWVESFIAIVFCFSCMIAWKVMTPLCTLSGFCRSIYQFCKVNILIINNRIRNNFHWQGINVCLALNMAIMRFKF